MRPAVIGLCLACAPALWAQKAGLTFYKDVLPILQEHCQQCHRKGELAPMSFASYKETRPWAKAIRESVMTRKMPPWFADPAVGSFRNDWSLTANDVAVLKTWADTGAVEGDPADAPEPRRFVEGWSIGEPDLVLEMPEAYQLPPSGTLPYTYVIIPTGLREDRWVQGLEIRAGNRSVVHHVSMFLRPPNSKWLREYPAGRAFVPANPDISAAVLQGGGDVERIPGYGLPGTQAMVLDADEAKLLPAGSDLVLELHYTPNGKPSSDRTRVGMVFAKHPPAWRVVTLFAYNATFVIPPGMTDYTVDGSMTLRTDAELVSIRPHMHLRGKSMEMRLVYPNGEKDTLLRVPRYDFNWQLAYQPATRKRLPAGTRIEATGVFDNSTNNPNNPDPKAEVRWGDQNWDEMMVGFVEVAIDAKGDLRHIASFNAGTP